MNVLTLVQESLKDLEENKIAISIIAQRCLRIASLTNDVLNIAFFKRQLIGSSKEELKEFDMELTRMILDNYDTEEKAKKAYEFVLEKCQDKYFKTRRVLDSEHYYTSSLFEFENSINKLRHELEKVKSRGFSVFDMYQENNYEKELENLYSTLKKSEKVINNIKSYLHSYLIKAETQILNNSNNERKGNSLKSKKVFIIHGHNEAKWRELKDILKEHFGLEPIVFQECPDMGTTTIIDKFEKHAKECSYAFAIFTPDDIVENGDKKYFQARPNVIYELGWFCAYLGRERVCILFQEGEGMDIFSDFQGVLQKRFKSNISEKFKEIQQELQVIGLI
ncbi:MAG: nucleotide-binding protein [Halanaerobiales bacterium]|nr:nucleotide-binding protein [Halanaerobiales bacterium]